MPRSKIATAALLESYPGAATGSYRATGYCLMTQTLISGLTSAWRRTGTR